MTRRRADQGRPRQAQELPGRIERRRSDSPDRIAVLTRLRLRRRHLSLCRARGSIPQLATRSSAPMTSFTTISAARPLADQPAAVQCGAAARRAGHRRPGDLHRAQARRPAGAAGRPAGRRRGPDRSRATSRRGCRSPKTEDEIQTLATAFNRMTGRLEEQTGALRAANTQLDTRRAFIEAVLSSVTAGVIALDSAQPHPAHQPLRGNPASAAARRSSKARTLADVSPDLDEFMRGEQAEANVIVVAGAGQRTLAVKRVRYQDGSVLTFDDITDQLTDQRRAAWSDIARRIAHEIKNPLTPIQLAAERLQRRFGAGDQLGQGDVRAADRDDRPPGRRPAADGRRILQFRAHAQAGVPRGEYPRDRPPGAVPARGRASRDHASRSIRRRASSRWSATAASSPRR